MKKLMFTTISALLAINLSAQISIIGTATPAGSFETDFYMAQDAQNPDLWGINIILTTGEVKFRQDGNWAVNWGGTTFPDGIGFQDGPNIIVTQEGNYYVTLNTSTGAYQFSIIVGGGSGITHQAVIRNVANEPVTNQSVGVRVSVIRYATNGPVVYSETHNPTSNANGLITCVIGKGTPVSGNFENIAWAAGPYFLKTEADPTGGSNYTITGTMQFLSVPYALHAQNSADAFVGDMKGNRIINLADPLDEQDAATKAYVDLLQERIEMLESFFQDQLPTVTTAQVSNVTFSSAISGGEVTDNGGAPVTIRGVVWSQTPNPTIEDNQAITSDGNGNGIFSSVLTELDPQTTYYLRAYATNSVGTAYGNEVSFESDEDRYPTGYVHCGIPTAVVEIFNPLTGRIWMDRNLGAGQVATTSTEEAAYGDLYQWGRFADGHQCRNSGYTSTLSTSDTPGHGKFINHSSEPNDWRNPQNDNLWQGVNGINNPCPNGFRLPTEVEWNTERMSWLYSRNDYFYQSPLKLPMAGRDYFGNIIHSGTDGYYWSSTVSDTQSRYLYTNTPYIYTHPRGIGYSVRCIKE